MPDQELNESHLTVGSASPFLPNTYIQFAQVKEKVDWLLKSGIRDGECLICHLAPNAKGYCPVSFGRAVKTRAHRIVYFVCNPIEDQSQMVLHKCDRRNCIEPNHLFAGTARDNTDDMIAKGRDKFVQPRRQSVYKEKILKLHQQGFSRKEIATKLYISESTVWNHISEKGPCYE